MYPCDFQNPCDKKLENKIVILTKYLLHFKSKLYVQNYNLLQFIYFYILIYNYIYIVLSFLIYNYI